MSPMSPLPKSIIKPKSKPIKIDDDDNDLKHITETTHDELKVYHDNLTRDISHLDNRLSHIQTFITNLDSQIKNIQQLISSDKNPGKKGNYYQIMNNCLELNANYEGLYIRCLELKQRYRKEQDDLKLKADRLIKIEIPKIKTDHDDRFNLTPGNLAMMMQSLTNSINKQDHVAEDLVSDLSLLQEDDDYKL